jgi:D-alanyl-D-alanine dipeptidase
MNTFRLLLVSGLLPGLTIALSFAGEKMNRRSDKTSLAASRQLVLVVTPDWNAVDGVLWRYERRNAKENWRPLGPGLPIVVGKKGMAWGSGLHELQSGTGPIKKEGDGKSPAGIFRLSRAFGYASADQAGAIRLPYTHLTGTVECVDDESSAHYNTILDRQSVGAPDWKSSEKMREQQDYYRWGVVVDHNSAPVSKGGGSCIFLHIWKQAGSGTAGCTAMKAAPMEELMRWLDPAAKPLLVQLPEAEYQRLRVKWQLPERK